jgi:DsbC/DsbD-like thiol-disulfide interchange protein
MKATLSPVEGSQDHVLLSIELAIMPGWHLYSNVPVGSAVKTTSVDLELPDGVEAVGEWERPIGRPSIDNPNTKIYSGVATFTRKLKINKSGRNQSIRITVDYQVCNEKHCLPPAKLKETLAIQAE